MILDLPLAIDIRAINGACKSVGNPGNGAVFISTALILLPFIEIEFPFILILLPLSSSLFNTASK